LAVASLWTCKDAKNSAMTGSLLRMVAVGTPPGRQPPPATHPPRVGYFQ
jgi:hypothetical protein